MQEKISKKTRSPNTIEQFIIERCVKNTRIAYIEMFILFLACDVVLWYLTFLAFGESFISGFFGLIFALVVGLFLLSIWKVIKEASIKSYKIRSDQGEWNIVFEGKTAKTMHPVSKVNGSKITMVIPEMVTIPKYGETQNIEFEYVEIFKSPPLFGYNNIFISIDKKGFTEKDKTYIQQLKPIGVLSIVLSISFCIILLFCFLIKFDSSSISYLCLGLFFIFLRTILRWNNNNRLLKSLKQES